MDINQKSVRRHKRRWTWKENHLRKNRFSFKGIRWKAEWYYIREKYCNEDHRERRNFERKALQKIKKGWDEEDVYFPTKWRDRAFYWW